MSNKQELDKNGRCWAREAISEEGIAILRQELNTGLKPGYRVDGLRFKKILPHILPVMGQAQELLPNCRPVRAVIFNKSSQTNWAVGWHQDRVIAVREKREVDGFRNWSQKSGMWHCEPPIEILHKMIFARLHLDASTTENGCIEVALSSHTCGSIHEKDLSTAIKDYQQEICVAGAGDVLFAKALLVHRSRPSNSDRSRLALRVDFSADELPPPLMWNY